MTNRILKLVTVGALLVAAFVVGSRGDEGEGRVVTPQFVAVDEAVEVTRSDVVATVGLPATIVANPVVWLTAAAPGRVEAIVEAGAPVAAGGQVATVGDEPVRAPVDGAIIEWLVPDGTDVPARLPIATYRANAFALAAELDAGSAYRLLDADSVVARASIDQGPGPFECAVVDAPRPTAAGSSDDETATGAPSATPAGPGHVVLCLIPPDVRAFAGATAQLAVEAARATDVLVVPVSAVRGSVDRGVVELRGADGSRTPREVELGITDGSVVEVVSGLEDGDAVSAVAPPLLGSDQ